MISLVDGWCWLTNGRRCGMLVTGCPILDAEILLSEGKCSILNTQCSTLSEN
jgi:hypothetical protein